MSLSPKSKNSGLSSISNLSEFTSQVNPLNPRQFEVHESQKRHQNTLNYIEFKARLDNNSSPRSFSYENYLSSPMDRKSSPISDDSEIQSLEKQLEHELALLEEKKKYIRDKIREANQALDDFHQEKKEQKALREQKKVQKRKWHEEELVSLRLKIQAEELDMKLSAEESNYLKDNNSEPLVGFDKSFELRRKLAKSELDSTKTKEILNKKRQMK